MRLMIGILAVLFAASWTTEVDARDRGNTYRAAKVKKDRTVRHVGSYYRRPSTVAANGLCQRDTGKPDDQLSFRNRCDTEEFWARIQDRAMDGIW